MPMLSKDKKRKVDGKKLNRNGAPKPKKSKRADEEITSESENESDVDEHESSSSSDDETPEEKRHRLAMIELEKRRAALKENEDEEDLAEQLRQEHLARTGKLHRKVADLYVMPDENDITWCHWCKLDTVTCVALMPDGTSVFSGSKDGTIVKWSTNTGEKLKVIPGISKKKKQEVVGHNGEVLCLAISYDGKFLVSGGKDNNIYVWNPTDCRLMKTLTGHRSPVVGLAFRIGFHDLYSCSERVSKTAVIKIWNLDEMTFVNTLMAADLAAIDCLSREHVVGACAQESNITLWKLESDKTVEFTGRRNQKASKGPAKNITPDNHLVHCSSIDCIRFINDQHVISGASDNSLAVWNLVTSRHPIATVKNAHDGGDGHPSAESWITSVATFRYSDLVASGSHDGFLRFWKCGENFRSITQLFKYPIGGFINGLEFSSDGKFLVVGVGKQHSRGRWFKPINCVQYANGQSQKVKNGICIIRLKPNNLVNGLPL